MSHGEQRAPRACLGHIRHSPDPDPDPGSQGPYLMPGRGCGRNHGAVTARHRARRAVRRACTGARTSGCSAASRPASPSTWASRCARCGSSSSCSPRPAASASRSTARTSSSCRRTPRRDAGRLPPWLEYAVAVAAALAAIGVAATSLPQGGLFVPALLACLGGALIWRQASDDERLRLRRLSRASLAGGDRRLGRVRHRPPARRSSSPAAVIVLARADFRAIRDGLLAMAVTIAGLALITGPWWMRMVSALTDERAERIRSQERADIAAHLHDSVLQTLALIQRNAESPREVARLARGQERELRTLLYGHRTASRPVRRAAAGVRGRGRGRVRRHRRGRDASATRGSTSGLAAVAAAAREAMVNAAKHSKVTSSRSTPRSRTTASASSSRTAAWVSTRTRSPTTGRACAGRSSGACSATAGRSTIRTAPGAGTEIEITMPRS